MFECLILQAEELYNSAIFASEEGVLVGRVFSEGRGYQALLVDEEKETALLIGSKKDESLYGVKKCGGGYVAVGHSGDRTLLLIYNRRSGSVRSFVGPRGILWQTNCKYAVGGLKENLWHLLLVGLKDRKGVALYSGENMYAYSLARAGGGYVMVGRVGYEGNYDGFVLWADTRMKPVKALRSGWKENDYLRYTNGSWAVGRIDMGGDSEGFVVHLAKLIDMAYRRKGFDYFRSMAHDGLLIAGEGEDEGYIRKSLLVHDSYGSLLGEGFSAVRFYDEGSMSAYGYVYLGGKAYAFRLRNSQAEPSFKYEVEPLNLKWKSLKLWVKRHSIKFREKVFPVEEVSYAWEVCRDVP